MSSSNPAGNAGPAGPTRLDHLRAQHRRAGEASFFYYDTHFRTEAVKVLPGEYFVSGEELPILTTLGSCIAACLWDRQAHVGGLNHFMLPDGDAESGRYGAYAMELLINELLKRGATRATLEAKVFGGGQVIAGMHTLKIGERNTAFVLDYLKTERVPVLSKDVLDLCARKVCFLPRSGKALVKRLTATRPDALLARDRAAARAAAPVAGAGGSIDLF